MDRLWPTVRALEERKIRVYPQPDTDTQRKVLGVEFQTVDGKVIASVGNIRSLSKVDPDAATVSSILRHIGMEEEPQQPELEIDDDF